MKNIFGNGGGQEDREYNKYLKIERDKINFYVRFEIIEIFSDLRFCKS